MTLEPEKIKKMNINEPLENLENSTSSSSSSGISPNGCDSNKIDEQHQIEGSEDNGVTVTDEEVKIEASMPIPIGKPQNKLIEKTSFEPQFVGSPRLTAKQEQQASESESTGSPLHSDWTLYFDKTPVQCSNLTDYTQNLRKIYTVSTIEGFWQVFNNIPTPNRLPSRCSYHLMRGSGERKPIWEDPLNENGGYWKLKCNKNNTATVWKELVLAAIGEQYKDNLASIDSVVGVSVSIRDRDDHFQIWNAHGESEPEASVLDKVKKLLPKVKFHSTFYKEHKTHHRYEKGSNASSNASFSPKPDGYRYKGKGRKNRK